MDKSETLDEHEAQVLQVRTALEVLWRPDPERRAYDVFALLDGARDPRVYPFVQRPGLFTRCLYDGDLPAAFARAAPHLVSLSREARSTYSLLDQGLGKSWGVFLHSDAPLEALQKHFHAFLQVKDGTGRRMFFRFFDPRVLRVYLPTCTRKELFAFFGPVRRFVVEAEHFGALEEFSVDQGELRRSVLSLMPEVR